MSNKYVVILVDNITDATKINNNAVDTSCENVKVEAFAMGAQMVGIRHRETRPTLIIDAIIDRNHPLFAEWYAECVLPNAVKAELIII